MARASTILVLMFAAVGVLRADERVLVVELLPGASHAWPEADRHLRAELAQTEFEVVALPLADDAEFDLVATVEREALARGALAALMVYRDDATGVVRLWVIDRWTGKLVARSLGSEGLDAGEAALRAVELLHASLIETRFGRPPTRPRHDLVERLVDRWLPAQPRWVLGLDVGVGVALAARSTPALTMHARGGVRAPYGLVIELAADVTLTSLERELPAGQAILDFAAVMARLGARSGGRVQAGASVGAGIMLAWGVGRPNEGWRGGDDWGWTGVFDARVEGRARLTGRLALTLGLTVRFAVPTLSVAGREVARPLALSSLSLAWEGT